MFELEIPEQKYNCPFQSVIQKIDKIQIDIPDTNSIEERREIVCSNEPERRLSFSFSEPR